MQTSTALSSLLPGLDQILKNDPLYLEKYVDTAEASEITGIPVPTLETWRVRGGGPSYAKLPRACRYKRRVLLEFMAGRERRSTSDEGQVAA